MKKAIILCINIFLILICGHMAFKYLYNEIVIYRYLNSDYSANVSSLTICNWFQPYIVHYNQGNLYYQNGDYLNASVAYENALASNPPEGKECPIRINMALTLIGSLGEDYDSPANIQLSIDTLKAARAELLEDDCATENGDGHSETAEKLKDEIDALLEELEKKQQEQEKQSGDSEEEPQKNEKQEQTKEQQQKEAEEKAFEEDVKKTMQQRQSEANQERREGMESFQEYNFDYDGLIW